MHATNRRPGEHSGECDVELASSGGHSQVVESEKKNHNGHEKRKRGEPLVIEDLAFRVPIREHDGSIPDKMHTPYANATHGYRRGEEKKPEEMLPTMIRQDAWGNVPIVSSSGRCSTLQEF